MNRKNIFALFGISTVAILACAYIMLAAAMGDCAPDAGCLSEAGRRLIFFGSPVLTLVIIGFTAWQLRKDKR